MVAILLLIIWENFLQAASTSSEISTGFLAKFQILWLQLFNTDFPISHHLLRKLGHFSEFFLLGIFTTLSISIERLHTTHNTLQIIYFGLMTALIDETIQYFSPGRSPQVSDILIDYLGFIFGFLLIYFIFRKKEVHYVVASGIL